MKEVSRTALSTLTGIGAFVVTQLSAGPTFAADYDVGSIHIAQPWSRATSKSATAGAGYMTINDLVIN